MPGEMKKQDAQQREQASQQDPANRDLRYLFDQLPLWMHEADRYASWYEGVERTIVLLLKCLNVETDPGRTEEGAHAFHENLLKRLSKPGTSFHIALGRGQVHETLWQAKNFRNMWRKNSVPKSHRACQPYLESVSGKRKVVEDGLLAAFDALGAIFLRVQTTIDERKEGFVLEMKYYNLTSSMKASKFALAEREKTRLISLAEDRAALEQEREVHKEHTKNTMAELDKRSADLDKREVDFQRALQSHETLEKEAEELKLANAWLEMERKATETQLEHQRQIDHSQTLELQQNLQSKTTELEHLQNSVLATKNSPDISHNMFYSILSQHQRSQEPQDISPVVEEGREANDGDLAVLLRDLLTSHTRAVNETKVAKDRQRALQRENETLEQRLASAQAQNATDRLVVRSALSSMENCVDPGIRMLKCFFGKQVASL